MSIWQVLSMIVNMGLLLPLGFYINHTLALNTNQSINHYSTSDFWKTKTMIVLHLVWVSESSLCTAKHAIFQLNYDQNKLHLMRWWWCSLCTRQIRSNTLPWFRANQSLLKYQFHSLWFDPTGAQTHNLPHSRRTC